MRNGLYRVEFITPHGHGTGVVVLQDGKVWGGDTGMYYVGTYDLRGDSATVIVRVDRHSQYPGAASVLGVDHANLTLTGTHTPDSANLRGTSAEAPGVQFRASLSRLCD